MQRLDGLFKFEENYKDKNIGKSLLCYAVCSQYRRYTMAHQEDYLKKGINWIEIASLQWTGVEWIDIFVRKGIEFCEMPPNTTKYPGEILIGKLSLLILVLQSERECYWQEFFRGVAYLQSDLLVGLGFGMLLSPGDENDPQLDRCCVVGSL